MSIEQHLFYRKCHTPFLLEIEQLKVKIGEEACQSSRLLNATLNERYLCQGTTQQSFFSEWPQVSFDELENLEIEGRWVKMFYKSFFTFLRLPEIVVKSFWLLFTVPEGKN